MSAPRPTGVLAQIGLMFRNARRLRQIREEKVELKRAQDMQLADLDRYVKKQQADLEATRKAILGSINEVNKITAKKESAPKADDIVNQLSGQLMEKEELQQTADKAQGDKDADDIVNRLSGRLVEFEQRKEADAATVAATSATDKSPIITAAPMDATAAAAAAAAEFAAEFAAIESEVEKAQNVELKDKKIK